MRLIKASVALEDLDETDPEALVGHKIAVSVGQGVVEYRLGRYLIQQDAFEAEVVGFVPEAELASHLYADGEDKDEVERMVDDRAAWTQNTTEVTDVTKRGLVIQVSREMLLEHGLVEPTPEERAQMERQHAEAEQRRAEHAAKLTAARVQLAAIVEEPARTILDLHCEDERGECQGCEFDGWEAEPPAWPCTTVVTIGRFYGVDVPGSL